MHIYTNDRDSLALNNIWGVSPRKLKCFWALAHYLWWKAKMVAFPYAFLAFTTSSVLAIKRTSIFWSSTLRCLVALISTWRTKYANSPRNAIGKLPHPQSGDSHQSSEYCSPRRASPLAILRTTWSDAPGMSRANLQGRLLADALRIPLKGALRTLWGRLLGVAKFHFDFL